MNELRKARVAAGLSAYALAQKAGTLEGRVFAFERQRFHPKHDEACRIARALGSTFEKMFPELCRMKNGGLR
jgi:transcriptional regulator with XRE-family HTH domain